MWPAALRRHAHRTQYHTPSSSTPPLPISFSPHRPSIKHFLTSFKVKVPEVKIYSFKESPSQNNIIPPPQKPLRFNEELMKPDENLPEMKPLDNQDRFLKNLKKQAKRKEEAQLHKKEDLSQKSDKRPNVIDLKTFQEYLAESDSPLLSSMSQIPMAGLGEGGEGGEASFLELYELLQNGGFLVLN